jgi:uncharacterized protein YqfB (UPF0267 family)
MILSFNPRFRAKILAGTKTQTIREDKKGRWKVGGLIHFATGVRTKAQETFKTATVVSINEVCISNYQSSQIQGFRIKEVLIKCIDPPIGHASWRLIFGEELQAFIKADGFDSPEDFWDWFDQPEFHGKIIAW